MDRTQTMRQLEKVLRLMYDASLISLKVALNVSLREPISSQQQPMQTLGVGVLPVACHPAICKMIWHEWHWLYWNKLKYIEKTNLLALRHSATEAGSIHPSTKRSMLTSWSSPATVRKRCLSRIVKASSLKTPTSQHIPTFLQKILLGMENMENIGKPIWYFWSSKHWTCSAAQ